MHVQRSSLRNAFSLLELLAVITILAIITVAVMPRGVSSGVAAKITLCTADTVELNKAIEQFYANNGQYPIDINELSLPELFPDGIPVCPVNGSPFAIDPVT